MKPARTVGVGLTVLLGVFLSFAAVALSQEAFTPAVPKQMLEQVSPDTGRPVILRQRGALLWGASTKPVSYGQPIPVLLWLYNPTSKPQHVETCGDISWSWDFAIDVFDSSGERVLSRTEQAVRADPEHVRSLPICRRNFLISIPPHTVMHGSFSKMEHDFAWDLREDYVLSPGRYTIVASKLDQSGRRIDKALSNPQSGLQIEITEP